MKVLNVKSLFLTALVAGIAFSSCKKSKDDVVVPPPAIEGTWVGKYGAGNVAPNKYFSFIINKDGSMKVKSDDPNKEYNGTGTWKLADGTFTAVYHYNEQVTKWNVAAKVNIAEGTMNGSYEGGGIIPSSGSFYMNRE